MSNVMSDEKAKEYGRALETILENFNDATRGLDLSGMQRKLVTTFADKTDGKEYKITIEEVYVGQVSGKEESESPDA